MVENIIVRPVTKKDLEGVYTLAQTSSHGLTTLSKDKSLEKKIDKAVQSFSRHIGTPKDELYLFVGEDVKTKRLLEQQPY